MNEVTFQATLIFLERRKWPNRQVFIVNILTAGGHYFWR